MTRSRSTAPTPSCTSRSARAHTCASVRRSAAWRRGIVARPAHHDDARHRAGPRSGDRVQPQRTVPRPQGSPGRATTASARTARSDRADSRRGALRRNSSASSSSPRCGVPRSKATRAATATTTSSPTPTSRSAGTRSCRSWLRHSGGATSGRCARTPDARHRTRRARAGEPDAADCSAALPLTRSGRQPHSRRTWVSFLA